MTTLKDLTPDSRNANKGTARGQKMIVASIAEDGFGRSILLDKNGRIIAGNKSAEASAEVLGVDAEVVVVETDGNKVIAVKRTDLDLDDLSARRLAYRDNLAGAFSFELDPDVVMADIESGFDFEAIDISLPDLGELMGDKSFGRNGHVVEDEAPVDRAAELQAKWGTELGQLWQLGAHRLLCGDCTDKDVVERVLDIHCHLMVTDPPYGVEYDPLFRERALGASVRRAKQVVNDNISSWSFAYSLFLGDVAYIWHADKQAIQSGLDLEQCSFEIRATIIWRKTHSPYGQGHYNYQHEPCWYAVRKNGRSAWCGDLKQSTVWDIPLDATAEGGHSTQKPVECMYRPIHNHEGDVYDPFLGSGTTLIACEQLARKCRAIEIDPGYVAVTLERWHTLTGEMPVLLDTSDS